MISIFSDFVELKNIISNIHIFKNIISECEIMNNIFDEIITAIYKTKFYSIQIPIMVDINLLIINVIDSIGITL